MSGREFIDTNALLAYEVISSRCFFLSWGEAAVFSGRIHWLKADNHL